MDPITDTPVRTHIVVAATLERAFHVFTAEFDSWWPREHHIGKSPMKRAILEEYEGGRAYSEQMDGTDCDWGTVLTWEPPHRFVLAWQINPAWQYEPDLAKSSEVEVTFTPITANSTRVELEHRHFSRHGAGADSMRKTVESPAGWAMLLQLYAKRAAQGAV